MRNWGANVTTILKIATSRISGRGGVSHGKRPNSPTGVQNPLPSRRPDRLFIQVRF